MSNFLQPRRKKLKDLNQDMENGEYVLLYPDGSKIKNSPGTDTPLPLNITKRPLEKLINGSHCTSAPLRSCCQWVSIEIQYIYIYMYMYVVNL